MRRTQVIIAGKEVDFERIENFPLSIKKRPDKFFTLGGAGGVELDSSLRSLVLPSTKRLHDAIGQAGLPMDNITNIELPVQIIVNGIPVFSGSAVLKKTSLKFRNAEKTAFDLFGDGKKLWRLLEGVTLRDLDIGEVTWTRANILDSWSKTYADGHKGLFAPAIYAQTTGDTGLNNTLVNFAFKSEDFRYHPYFSAITKAIFDYVGYTIDSEIFEHPIFQESVHFFHGDKYPVFSVPPTGCTFNAINFNSQSVSNFEVLNIQNSSGGTNDCVTFLPDGTTIEFVEADTYTFNFEATGNGDFSDTGIEIWKNGTPATFVLAQPTDNSGGFSWSKEFELTFEAGDTLQIYANSNSTGNITFLSLQAKGNTLSPINSVFYVQGCLPAVPVKNFLKGISHIFCLAWEANDTLRKISFDPRFPWEVDGVRYAGFYKDESIEENYALPEEVDHSNIEKNQLNPYGSQVVLAFQKQSQYSQDKFPNDSQGISAYGVLYKMRNENLKATTNFNPYFDFVPQGSFNTILASDLPVLIADFDSESGLSVAEEAEYNNIVGCGLVYRGNATIRLDGSSEPVLAPWVSQYLHKKRPNGNIYEKSYQISYGDTLAVNPGLHPERINGTGTMFYRDYMATCRRGLSITGKLKTVFWKIITHSLRRLRSLKINQHTASYIITEINGFKPTQYSLTGFKAIQKFTANVFDYLEKESHYSFQQIENTETFCDYTLSTNYSSSASVDVVGIYLPSEVKIPLDYPYTGSVASEVQRLQEDIEKVFGVLNFDFQGVSVQLTSGQNWEIQIQGINMVLGEVEFLTNGSSELRRSFIQNNCV